MTRPSKSVLNKHSKTCALVLDGNTVKARLQAERFETQSVVHVDWVRFTCFLRNSPFPSRHMEQDGDGLESLGGIRWAPSVWDLRWQELQKQLAAMPDNDYAASVQAKELAVRVAEALGADFEVFPEVRKGHDFYRFRWSIVRGTEECAWVGYLASGDSPRQASQSKTIHANIYGSATTFAEPGWNDRIASICEDLKAVLTRCDLALDFFDGISGGMERIKADYMAGLCDSGGKRLKCNMVGDWANGKGRSFYLGSKEAGKQTNVYEKGFQLFGEKDASSWMRVELRYGNKLRELPIEMLRRPQDHFAGASDWHSLLLREHGLQLSAVPAPVPCTPSLPGQTIEAEVTRNCRWLLDVAAPSLSLAFQYLGVNEFLELVENKKAPGRLQRFTKGEIATAYGKAHRKVNNGSGAGHVLKTAILA